MKMSVIKTGLFLLAVVAMMACNKVKPKKVEKAIVEGNWKVASFSEDGVDETYYFAGYTFTFSDNGTVTATNGSTTISGTWSVTDDNSNDDDSSSDVDFNLYFPDTNNFDELTDDWDIVTSTDTQLELVDVSGGNGGTDKLTFTKL